MIEIANEKILKLEIAKFLCEFPEKTVNLDSDAAVRIMSFELANYLVKSFTPSEEATQLRFDF